MKRKKGKLPLYKDCIKCGHHSYYTTGEFYYCTNGECLYKDYLNGDKGELQNTLIDEDEEENS